MKTTFAVAALALVAGSAMGQTLANWTFETSAAAGTGTTFNNGPAEGGLNAAGSASSGTHSSSATTWSNPAGNGSAKSLSSNNWGIGDFYLFRVSTVGYTGITFGWDQNRSSTGPSDFTLEISTDGSIYSPVTNYVVANVTWSSGTGTPSSTFAPVALGPTADNQANLYVRLRATSAPSSANGTNRIDNVLVTATVPAPGAVALLGLAGLVAGRRRRNA